METSQREHKAEPNCIHSRRWRKRGRRREEDSARVPLPGSLQGNISVTSFHQALPLKGPTPPRSTGLGSLGSLGTFSCGSRGCCLPRLDPKASLDQQAHSSALWVVLECCFFISVYHFEFCMSLKSFTPLGFKHCVLSKNKP